MPNDIRPVESHILYVGEASDAYCFDFQDYPEVTNGETLSAPTASVTTGNALVTLASPTVLTSAFTQLDRNGNTMGTVPIGKGVKVLVTPGSVTGQCTVTCLVVCSGGATRGKKVNFVVR